MHITAAELYGVDGTYKRYDQKNNLMIRVLWDEEIKQLHQLKERNLQRYIANNESGYSRFDDAYLAGSMAYMEKIDCGINICDRRANAWNGKKGDRITGWNRRNLTKAVKKAAKMYGANAVGVAKLDRRWVYSRWFDPEKKDSYPLVFSDEDKKYEDIKEPALLDDGTRVIPAAMKNVIVLLFQMNYHCLQYSPKLLAYANSYNVYASISFVLMNLTGFIRHLGYNAIPSINCTALNIPLAIDAGLGQMGRNGKLINPHFGTRFRIAKILTDLPLEYDRPIDFGVIEFCDACRKCARECPAGAISDGPRTRGAEKSVSNSGYLRWEIDHVKCLRYWSECGTNCNICISMCSYNRGYRWTENILKSMKNSDERFIDTLLETLDENEMELFERDRVSYWLED